MTRFRTVLTTLVLGLGACTTEEASSALDKDEIRDLGGSADAADFCLGLGYQAECDICLELGWYDDGVCDSDLVEAGLCAGPDPDCDAGEGACPTDIRRAIADCVGGEPPCLAFEDCIDQVAETVEDDQVELVLETCYQELESEYDDCCPFDLVDAITTCFETSTEPDRDAVFESCIDEVSAAEPEERYETIVETCYQQLERLVE